MNLKNTKFKPVFPNETIYSKVRALRSKGRTWRFERYLYDINESKVSEAEWSAMIMDKYNE